MSEDLCVCIVWTAVCSCVYEYTHNTNEENFECVLNTTCMHTRTQAHYISTHSKAHAYMTHMTNICSCAPTYTHTNARTHTHMHMHTHTLRAHTHMHTYTHAHTLVRTHTRTCTHTRACTHAHAHTHTYTHTYSHICHHCSLYLDDNRPVTSSRMMLCSSLNQM